MRKFTKEISALLASAAVGAAAFAGTLSASSEQQIERTAGIMAIPDETTEPATQDFPPTAGTTMAETEPTTVSELPPTAGEPMPPDEYIEPPTLEILPPTAGVPMPPDIFTEPSTEEQLPPLSGMFTLPDGDVNSDGILGISDVVMLQKWLLAVPDAKINNWKAADLNYDGYLDVFDLCLLKKELIKNMNDTPQKTSIPFSLLSVTDVRNNIEGHSTWKGFVADSEKEMKDIIRENEGTDLTDIDSNIFKEKDAVIIYSLSTAGNSYSIISDISANGNTIEAAVITMKPIIATPDMMCRRYILLIDKTEADSFIFNDTSEYYQNEEEDNVFKWFKNWCNAHN